MKEYVSNVENQQDRLLLQKDMLLFVATPVPIEMNKPEIML